MMKCRVFVVFCETVSPLGQNAEQLALRLQENYSAVGPMTHFDASGLTQPQACEVKEDLISLLPSDGNDWGSIARYDRKFALLAAVVNQHKVKLQQMVGAFAASRVGISLGLGANVFPMENIALEVEDVTTEGLYKTLERVNKPIHNKFNAIFNHTDLYANYLQHTLGRVGFSKNILTACSSSTQSLAYAASSIMAGQADLMLAGGTDSILNNFAYISFGKLGVLTNDVCRPFDVNRSGAIAGECAGIAVLASEEGVKALGVDPEFELIGFGNTLDAHKITAPDPSGLGVERAMRKAMDMAGCGPEQIQYINAHGTGTRSNDEVELKAIERVMGDAAREIYVSSTKDRHGHSIAAAGIQEFQVLLSSMKQSLIPANLNIQKPIETSLQLPMSRNVKANIKVGMTNNFAFGGVNCSLIIKHMKA